MAWEPCGVVTLTTDFGRVDAYVGTMTGVLLARCPGARVVDLTHDVPPQDVRTASFQLAHAWRYFPAGTVHVAVVDPGVGSPRRILVAEEEGHAFVAPDNGLLASFLGHGARLFALDVERFSLPERSRTFHGRDVFAPAAAALAAGMAPEESGPPAGEIAPGAPLAAAERHGDRIETEVLLVDRFGNLISGLVPGPEEGDLAAWEVRIAGRRVPIRGTYAEAAPGELLALVDSCGHLEVAARGGDAAAMLGVGVGEPLKLRRTKS